ncbi:MAG: DUF86 domain-containing protein [Lautropia sp.]|nr:MAG: DUF86 domain-containing protein [Pseudomonadota bacterium]MBC6959738.1 DUF86 domain-containing protein [Lautropia sp.]MBW7926181.1 DUF86 domain-containing protein [Burkholderiaceae bacterium]MDL1906154.1 DUF86 domain-containing protein [Betaproteobacteria bacterium PRO1]MEB2336596.1 DUF86 domain-containing protein [Burkholderiales bacterium]
MHADAQKLIWDALQAADRASRFSEGKSFTRYQADEMLRSAVERQLEIVGEALNRLRQVDPEVAADIPDLARIVGFRNVLIHGYASVDDRIVWGIIEGKLQALRRSLTSLLAAS